MKDEKKQTPATTPDKKEPVENPEKGSGKQDREQARTEGGDDFSIENVDDKPPVKESVTFEQDVHNEQTNDPERDPQKRSPLGEDPSEIAKQGKEFEPGIDEGNKDAI